MDWKRFLDAKDLEIWNAEINVATASKLNSKKHSPHALYCFNKKQTNLDQESVDNQAFFKISATEVISEKFR